jgi:hypothetical protein
MITAKFRLVPEKLHQFFRPSKASPAHNVATPSMMNKATAGCMRTSHENSKRNLAKKRAEKCGVVLKSSR